MRAVRSEGRVGPSTVWSLFCVQASHFRFSRRFCVVCASVFACCIRERCIILAFISFVRCLGLLSRLASRPSSSCLSPPTTTLPLHLAPPASLRFVCFLHPSSSHPFPHLVTSLYCVRVYAKACVCACLCVCSLSLLGISHPFPSSPSPSPPFSTATPTSQPAEKKRHRGPVSCGRTSYSSYRVWGLNLFVCNE